MTTVQNEWNMKPRHRRATILAISFLCAAVATSLGIHLFFQNMVYFTTPSQINTHKTTTRDLKMGGMVVAHSFVHETDKSHTPINVFEVTDGQSGIVVHYKGILPDLFREGQSVVVIGKYQPKDKYFLASEVLAKHDETYMPKEVAEALQKSGKWDPRFGPAPDKSQWQTMIKSEGKIKS